MKCCVYEIETEFAIYRRETDEIRVQLPGNDISLPPGQWEQLVKEMPEAMRILTSEKREM